MDNIHPEFLIADELIKDYISNNDKFRKRFVSLSKDIEMFIEKSGYKDQVQLNEIVLGYALVDYFEDIRRLKSFHGVDHINSIKIVSYISYWLLKRKPIQVIKSNKSLIYINERFVTAYILDSISFEDKQHLLLRDNSAIKSFNESLFYYLKYRLLNAHSIEMVLMAFMAGRVYQETNFDLSSQLLKYDFDN